MVSWRAVRTPNWRKDAIETAATCTRRAAKPTETVPYLISKHMRDICDRNLHSLECIMKFILPCGMQNISLRVHRDDSTCDASNKGKFLAVLDLLAGHEEGLRKHLETAPENARGSFKTFRSEIIHIIGQHTVLRMYKHNY